MVAARADLIGISPGFELQSSDPDNFRPYFYPAAADDERKRKEEASTIADSQSWQTTFRLP